MSLNSQIIVVIISFACVQITVAAISIKPNVKQGCSPLNGQTRCIWYHEECDTVNDSPCTGGNICCENECGSSCRLPNYMKPSPTEGCPPEDTRATCFQYYEECNDERKCGVGEICCGNECGTFCFQ